MEHASAFHPSVLMQWRKRENLLPGLALLVLAVGGWAYIIYQARTMGAMEAMNGARISTMGGVVPFVLGWTAMMVAMMFPAAAQVWNARRAARCQRLLAVFVLAGPHDLADGRIGPHRHHNHLGANRGCPGSSAGESPWTSS